jgi:prevent-host-death family protein
MKSLSATEAARNFADVLDRVEEQGERFLIVRRGRVVARLEPAAGGVGRSLKDVLRRAPRDAAWADDLRAVRASVLPEERGWRD